MIYKDVVCWVLFRTKFDCNFTQSFVPVFIVGFDCNGLCVRERVCEDSSNWSQKSSRGYLATKHPTKRNMCPAHDWNAKGQSKSFFTGISRVTIPRKGSMWLAHDWNAKSQYKWWQLGFASISRVKPSREIPAKHSVLPNCTIWSHLSIPSLYINPHYPQMWRRASERKP